MNKDLIGNKNPDLNFWKNKKVLITGHTGFKGSWLSFWLLLMNAKVHGISLEPLETPNLFQELDLAKKLNNNFIDIRNRKKLRSVILKIKPDIIFHLAAQPLVIESYLNPIETWETNLMGTSHVLDILRDLPNKCACVCITTDKVYKPNSYQKSFKEDDQIGGIDPYSSSKAACEIAIESFRESFCGNKKYQKNNSYIASARAGNIIGGGDWSENRIIPDIIKSIFSEKKIVIRQPKSIRPWQNVLDPLLGYLKLAENLFIKGNQFATSFNFGPTAASNKTVFELMKSAEKYFPISWEIIDKDNNFYETPFIGLEITKAQKLLNWEPKYSFEESIEKTMIWYKKYYQNPAKISYLCKDQIEEFLSQ